MKATPVVSHRVDVEFSIDPVGAAPPPWIERTKWHFQMLDLGTLYSQHAAVELVQCKHDFRSTYIAHGSQGLKEELSVRANSRSKPFPNAWQPALYRGLAASKEFCENGFERIEE